MRKLKDPMKNERIILAGGSGFLGRLLAGELIRRGAEVVILSRNGLEPTLLSSPAPGSVRTVRWDGATLGPWAETLNGARAVVNLTGRSVNCRHTPENRQEIIDSRVNSVKVVSEAIQRCTNPPPVLVQASSLAIYGDPGDKVCNEKTPYGDGFPAEVCRLWEEALADSHTPRTRRVVLRIGFVLGASGGALSVLARLTKLGLGGRIGNGRQYISWIHETDMNQMFVDSIERNELEGAFNATAPHPVTNTEFMRQLRRALHRPWSPPAPAWAVRIGSWFMRTEPGLALGGRRCVPTRLLEQGFQFRYPQLGPALSQIYAR
jgi:uncharacterized protein (TIGR01777 family)